MQLTSTSANGVLFVSITKKSRLLYSGNSTTPDNSNKVPGWVSRNLSGPYWHIWTHYRGWHTRLGPSPAPRARSWASTPEPPEEGGKGIVARRKTQVPLCSVLAPSVWQVVPGPTDCSPLRMPQPWWFLHKQISVLARNELSWSCLPIMGSCRSVIASIPSAALALEIPKNVSSALRDYFQDAAMILFCY